MNKERPSISHRAGGTRAWADVTVTLHKSVIFEGRHGVRSTFFHMAPGCVIPRHTHSKWVQVMVLKGQMRVEQDGSETFYADEGGVYFVEPGYVHVETSVVDPVVLVTQGEDRPGVVNHSDVGVVRPNPRKFQRGQATPHLDSCACIPLPTRLNPASVRA